MHLPVLLKEVVEYLGPRANENFVDCTLGEGGHSLALLEKNKPHGRVLAIEQDPDILKRTKEKIQNPRLILVNDNFANLKDAVEKTNFRNIAGILADLGLSSWHLEESQQGFSFLRKEPLLMNIRKKGLTARDIVNQWPENILEKTLREYGQERFAQSIAKQICSFRKTKPIQTTACLAEIIKRAVPKSYEKGRIHPATRTFLALRIVVNDELGNLQKLLKQSLEVLKKNGRLVVISFNSLEDAMVKRFFREQEKLGRIKILTKRPVLPGPEEKQENPRSRSAKLRAAINLS